MHALLRLIQSVDVSIYYFLSRFHGHSFIDRLASHLESNTLFKSGLLIAGYWYFWFRRDQQQERRNNILTIIVGTLVGLVITRLVATFAPFRIRPMYDPRLVHHALAIPIPTDFVNWSSFPSDHAAYLVGLGVGLIYLSRRHTAPIVLYLAAWICLPRMYLGIHYASDIIVGAIIGAVAVWASLNLKWVESRVARPLLAFSDAKPQLFYAGAFLVMFEMATLFWDIRQPIHEILHMASSSSHKMDIAFLAILLCGIAVLIAHSSRGTAARSGDTVFTSAKRIPMPTQQFEQWVLDPRSKDSHRKFASR